MVFSRVGRIGLLGVCACGLLVLGTGAARAEADDAPDRVARIENALVRTLVIGDEAETVGTLRERMEHHRVPGVSVAVIDGGEIAWARAYGMADLASRRPVTTETRFQAASISKPIAALGALALVDDGRLELDAPVNASLRRWTVPENDLTEASPVTLRHLLSHTAGLTQHGFPGYAAGEPVPTPVGVLEGEGNTPPVRVDLEPGSAWRYSGGGYVVAQVLIEDASGEPFPEYMRRRVLGPLGMDDTGFEQPLPADLAERAATGHTGDGSPLDGRFHTYPELAAAGLWTTPTDLARALLALQDAAAGGDHPVLSARMVRAMLTPGEGNWGLGPWFSESHARIGHGGSNEGFRCEMTAFLDGGRGAVIMTNADSGGVLAREILLSIAREYGWAEPRPETRDVADLGDGELSEIAGVYRGGPGEIRVRVLDGMLLGSASFGGHQEIRLWPASREHLFARNGMTFDLRRAEDGSIEALVVRGMEFTKIE